MTLVRGPNLGLAITDRAMEVLGAPGSVLPRVWLLLEQHGRRRTPAEYELGVAPARMPGQRKYLSRVPPGRFIAAS
jgi:hypothetical protein